MLGETTIFHVKIWNHPIETTILKWMFQVPGRSVRFYTLVKSNLSIQLGIIPPFAEPNPALNPRNPARSNDSSIPWQSMKRRQSWKKQLQVVRKYRPPLNWRLTTQGKITFSNSGYIFKSSWWFQICVVFAYWPGDSKSPFYSRSLEVNTLKMVT